MSNTINYAVKYLDMLDRVYKASAVTAILEASAGQYKMSATQEQTLYLRKLALQGLGDYSRATGYDEGDATVTWEAHTFAIDRSKKFTLDTMDSKEAYQTIAELGAEFERVHVAPELDAYRFEKICTLCGLDVSADLTEDTIVSALDTGIETLDDAEVPKEGRVLFISNTAHGLLKRSGENVNVRFTNGDNAKINRKIEMYDDMPVVKVPSARFYNNFDFASSGAGGFTPNVSAKAINFMIGYAPSLLGIKRHIAPKIITPQLNQTSDGWIYAYRIYHDLFVPQNKVNGTYIHTVA